MKHSILIFAILLLGSVVHGQARPDYSALNSQEEAFFRALNANYGRFVYKGIEHNMELRQMAYDRTRPLEADSSYTRAWPLNDNDARERNRYTVDAHHLALDEPQQFDILTPSIFAPPGVLEVNSYYRLPDEFRAELYIILESNNTFVIDSFLSFITMPYTTFSEETNGYDNSAIMGEWYILKGKDSSGTYISYYDEYYPPKELEGGKSFYIYDRIYIEDIPYLHAFFRAKFNTCKDPDYKDCY